MSDYDGLNCRFPPLLRNVWGEVSTQTFFTPRADDVGRMLHLEVRLHFVAFFLFSCLENYVYFPSRAKRGFVCRCAMCPRAAQSIRTQSLCARIRPQCCPSPRRRHRECSSTTLQLTRAPQVGRLVSFLAVHFHANPFHVPLEFSSSSLFRFPPSWSKGFVQARSA